MVSRGKYLRVPDLYVEGTEFVLRDGTVLWLQVPNPFEYDEARHDAAVARSRLTLAIRTHGHDELDKVRGQFLAHGLAGAIEVMVESRSSEFLIKIYDGLRVDPDWRERVELIDRGEELLGRAPEDAERQLLLDIGEAYSAELERRVNEESEGLRARLRRLSEDDLWEEFQDFYITRRGGELGLAEFRLTELWYAARCCDAVRTEDGGWDHGACDGHREQVWEAKAEVRALPAELQTDLVEALAAVTMTERQAKNSARQRNGSASSPLPSEAEESTPSTPAETPDAAPGLSTPPSRTPSPSLAGSS